MHGYTDKPVCPHCGHEHHDVWEWFRLGQECATHECDNCGREFDCSQHVEVSYSTSKPSAASGQSYESLFPDRVQ